MIRSPLLAVALLLAGTSAAQASAPRVVDLATGTDGTAAVLLAPGGPGGPLDLRVRPAGGPLTAPRRVARVADEAVAAVLPDGAVRITWRGATFDPSAVDPDAAPVLRSAVRERDGTLGPVQTVPLPESVVRLATAPDGATLAAWPGGVAVTAGREPLAVGPMPPGVGTLAVADGGRALLVGDACDSTGCRPWTVDRAPGGSFTAPQPLPAPASDGVSSLEVTAALASTGAAVVATAAGPTFWHRGPAGTAFGAAQALGGPGSTLRAGVAADGRAILEQRDFEASTRVRVAPAGTATAPERSTRAFELLDVTDDGTLVAADQYGVLRGTVDGPTTPVPDTAGVVALTAGPRPALVLRRVADGRERLTLVTADGAQRLADGRAPAARPSGREGRLRVAPGPLRRVRNRLSVPLYCAPPGSCAAVVRTPRRRSEVSLPARGSVDLDVRLDGRDRRIAVRIDPRERRARTVRRRATRRPDPRACPTRPWWRRVAADGRVRLWSVPEAEEGQVVERFVLCGRGRAVTAVRESADDLAYRNDVVRFGVAGDRVALLTVGRSKGETSRAVTLAGLTGGAPARVEVADDADLVRLLPTRSGAFAAVSRLRDGRLRILLHDAAGPRIADAGPGVDPGSLRVDGDTVRWTTQGAPHGATVSGAAAG